MRNPPTSHAVASQVGGDRERARFRWHDVSLACELAGAQHARRRAVVRSLSATGAVLTSDVALAVGTRLRFDVSLGLKSGHVRCHARVVDRGAERPASEDGVELRFDQPQLDLVERLEQLHQRCPNPIALAADGRITWPIANQSKRPAPEASANGLQVWSGRAWARISPTAGQPGNLGDEAGRLAWLKRALAVIRASHEPTVALAFRGALLNSGDGVPCDELFTVLRAEPASMQASLWLASIDPALRVVAFLDALGWRLEALEPTHREPIEQLRKVVASVRRELSAEAARARQGSDRERATVANGLDDGLGKLDAFLDGISVSVECPGDPEPDSGTGLDRLPSAGDLGSQAAPAKSQARTWLTVAALLAITLGGMASSTLTLIRANPVPIAAPIDAAQLRAILPVDAVSAHAWSVELTVPASWSELPFASRRAAMLAACQKLGDLHYANVLVRDPNRRQLASWHDSALDIAK